MQILMRNNVSIFLLVLAGACVVTAQGTSGSQSMQSSQALASPQSEVVQAQIDPAKKADIQRLLDLVGTKTLMQASMDSMATTIRPLVTNSLPPGEYRERLVDLFFVKFRSLADPTQFLDESGVAIYDKHFSDEEIKGLIKFYETPLGQKAVSSLPQVTNDLREAGKSWGERVGHQAMQQVLAEHPEMVEALKAAKAGSK
jgi:uncharacterized protein